MNTFELSLSSFKMVAAYAFSTLFTSYPFGDIFIITRSLKILWKFANVTLVLLSVFANANEVDMKNIPDFLLRISGFSFGGFSVCLMHFLKH